MGGTKNICTRAYHIIIMLRYCFNTPLCNCLLDFLTNRPQSVWVGNNASNVITGSTGPPQGCILSLLLFTLMTYDCCAKSTNNHIVKFA